MDLVFYNYLLRRATADRWRCFVRHPSAPRIRCVQCVTRDVTLPLIHSLASRMRTLDGTLVLSPSDLSNFLSCRHRAGLDLAVARKQLTRPAYADPYAAMLRQHGEDHERAYVDSLRAAGKSVVDLEDVDDAAERTREAMRAGVDVIVQARLEGDAFAGYADILLRVEHRSDLGDWSYEVHDTKLARETKAGTILQLSAYSDMVARVQGLTPEHFHVVTPVVAERYRVEDYAAYYRMVLATLRAELAKGHDALIARLLPGAGGGVPRLRLGRQMRRAAAQGRSPLVHRRRWPLASRRAGRAGTRHAHRSRADAGAGDLQAGARRARNLRAPRTSGARAASAAHREAADRRTPADRRRRGTVPIAATVAGRSVPRSRGRARSRAKAGANTCLACGVRTAPKGVPYEYRAWWAFDDAEEKAAFEAVIDLIMTGLGGRPGHARLSLQPLRADRVQEADGALRDARGGARSAAARGAVRRSLSHRPAGRARRRRELLDQAARTVFRLHAKSRARRA